MKKKKSLIIISGMKRSKEGVIRTSYFVPITVDTMRLAITVVRQVDKLQGKET